MLNRGSRIKCGITLILIGICIPVILIGFTSRYIPKIGFIANMQRMEIVLRAEKKSDIFDEISGGEISGTILKTKIAIPYRYIFALGTLLVFVGLGITAIIAIEKENNKER